jgi:hypothetical protein
MLRRSARALLALLFFVVTWGGAVRLACLREPSRDPFMGDPVIPTTPPERGRPSRVEVSRRRASPLVEQARQFGHYLRTSPPQRIPALVETERTVDRFHRPTAAMPPEAHPHGPSPKFEVRALSLYPSRPEMSMALIAEPGSETHWVKCGAQTGHFSIEAIHREYIVWRNGEQTGRISVTTASTGNEPMRALAHPARNRQERQPKSLVQKDAQSTTPPRIKSKAARRGLVTRP